MRLYEISQTYQDFLAAVESGDIPMEAVADTLASIEGEFDEKADSIACLIKDSKAEVEAIKAEEKRLKERRAAKENAAERMRAYLLEQMRATGRRKLETSRNVISVSGTAASVKIADTAALYLLRPDLFTAPAPVADKIAIKELLKSGEEIPGVSLEKGEALKII